MGRAEDSAVPVAHEQVFGVLEAIAAGFCAEALLALLELLEEAEVAGHLGAHCEATMQQVRTAVVDRRCSGTGAVIAT